ncbi:glycosyltransferase family 2 protein [Halobaculum rubrum]|uniref:glycosyltransferase family 2 protein n=1 Tax=Halobaculum rubrum TaxID=2872158 RepID=UPI001CA3EC46|nr:glycosyltransferase family 2 protein [Halobaculum rubrum]QZX99902.1 glycosyltransferase family 2 protein [Halobaculum rubrum]
MTDSTEPRVVISVLNWNQREETIECIEALRTQTNYPNVDIVVVDNGSEDGSVTAIRQAFPEVRLIENETNRGFGPAHNQVMESRDANYYVLFNNDADPEEGWLTPLVEYAEANPDVGVQGPELRFPDGSVHSGGFFGPFGGERRIVDQGETVDVEDVDWVSGAVFFISNDVVTEVGTLDEIFAPIYFEEVDYCWRVGADGYRVVYNPNGIVTHDGSAGDESERVMFLMRKHEILFKAINYPARWLPCMAVDELRSFAGALFAPDRGDRIVQYARAYASLVREAPEIWQKRSERRRRHRTSDIE